MYKADFRDIAIKLLPNFLRKNRLIDFIAAALSPLQHLNDSFNDFVNQKKYQISFNAQVIYLEHYLNDLYDNAQRRIFISDGNRPDSVYFFNQIEQQPPVYMFNSSENKPLYTVNKVEYYNFVHYYINIPQGISYDTVVLNNQVKQYNLASKIFQIKTF